MLSSYIHNLWSKFASQSRDFWPRSDYQITYVVVYMSSNTLEWELHSWTIPTPTPEPSQPTYGGYGKRQFITMVTAGSP